MTRSSFAHFGARNLHFAVLILAVGLALSLIPQIASSEGTLNMKINITVSGKTVTATVMDNPTAKDFVSLLPLTMSMKDLFGREKFGHLQKALSEKGPRKNTYEVGDIAYWSPALISLFTTTRIARRSRRQGLYRSQRSAAVPKSSTCRDR